MGPGTLALMTLIRCWQNSLVSRSTGNTVYCIFNYSLYTEQCTLKNAHFPLITSHFTLHTSHFTLNTSQFTLHILHFTIHTSHFTLLPFVSCTFNTLGIRDSVVLAWGDGEGQMTEQQVSHGRSRSRSRSRTRSRRIWYQYGKGAWGWEQEEGSRVNRQSLRTWRPAGSLQLGEAVTFSLNRPTALGRFIL